MKVYKFILPVMFLIVIGIGFLKNIRCAIDYIETDRSNENVENASFDSVLSENVADKWDFVNLYGLFAKMTGINEVNGVYKLKNGHGVEVMEDCPDEILENNAVKISSFNEFCKKRGIKFLYAQAPYKIDEYNSRLPLGVKDYSNLIADKFLQNLNGLNVNTLDLRNSIRNGCDDYYDAFLKTEHHWSSLGGILAYNDICKSLLQEEYYLIDNRVFDINSFDKISLKKKSIGYYGQKTGKYFLKPEDFSLFLPTWRTVQKCTIVHKNLVREGSFSDAIFDYSYSEQEEDIGLYGTYIGGDYPMVIHESETAPIDKTVVMFIDSFGTITSSYLSLVFKRVYVYDLRWILRYQYTETAAYLVDSLSPEFVIVQFNPNQLIYEDSEQFRYGVDSE